MKLGDTFKDERYLLTGEQCRAARELLGMSEQELATAARTEPSTIRYLESGTRGTTFPSRSRIRVALESAGIEFTNGDEPGVRLRNA